MRNLKRALSLALASVMLVGMMVVGTSAASYPDVDNNDNVEAISVLQAVKVMVGNENGDFEPDKNVTRNEMAVIMARLLLGPDAEDYVGTHPFTDVPAWADKYVAACYNEGIVAGMTETTYGGSGDITAQQAAAMMLRALGYEKLEGTGSDWARKVVAKANEISLFKDVGSNPNAALNRNQIAQLGLNTLKADVVVTSSGTNIDLGEVGSITTDVKYDKVANETTDDYRKAIGDKDKVQQLCEKLYGKDLVLDSEAEDGVGRPASTWTYDKDDVITIANEADYTVVLDETPGSDQKLLDEAKKNLSKDTGFKIVLNGDESATYSSLGAGDIAEFHLDDEDSKKVEAVFVTRYELDKITDIDTDVDDDDAEDGVSCYVDFDGNGGTKINDTDIPGFNGNYVEDAYVALLIADDGEIVDSYIPETVEDSIDTNKNNTEFTIGKTKYTVAKGFTSSVGDCVVASSVKPGSDNTYTLYLDSNGYVLGVVEVEGESTSIDDVYYLDTVWKNQNGMSNTYHAQLVDLEGTKREVQLETKDHTLPEDKNDLSDTTNYSNFNALNGLLVTISDKKTGDSKANNDKYNLKVWNPSEDWDADKLTGNLGELKKDTRSVTVSGGGGATYRLNGSTVYLFLEDSADDLAVSRYVGGVAYNTAASNAMKANKSYVITEKDKNVAKYVIISTDDAGQTAEYSEDVIFIKEKSDAKGDGFRSQTVYLPDGKEETWKIDEGEYGGGGELEILGDPAFFTYSENDDGYYELDDPDPMYASMTDNKDWQDDKDEGIVSDATFDDHNDLFEDMLTVTFSGHKIKDIDVKGASFKDLHDDDDEDQYNKTVNSLSALAKAIEDNKCGAATLYMNVSENGAVTIFVTEIDKYVAPCEHTELTKHDAEAGTDCQTKGTAVYWECSACHQLFSDENGETEIDEAPEGAVGPHSYAYDTDSDPRTHSCTVDGCNVKNESCDTSGTDGACSKCDTKA